MVQFDNKNGQIKIKVVYFGPALGGKTTCLRSIHRTLDPGRRTKLYSLNTASDRTLFFDLLSLNLGQIRGYSLMTQLYTVPGQVQYATTRKIVLAGADAVVFVADSHPDRRKQNLQSLEDLWVNAGANGLKREELPLVLQYNKRDLKQALPVSEMEEALNLDGRPSFPTVALTGAGVMEAFSKVCEDTLMSVAGRLGLGSNQKAIDRLIHQARAVLQPFVGQEAHQLESDSRHEVTISEPGALSDRPLVGDNLVEAAVRTNMVMTERNAALDERNQRIDEQFEARTKGLRQQMEQLERENRQEKGKVLALDKRCQALRNSQALLGQMVLRVAAVGQDQLVEGLVAERARRAADLAPLLAADIPLTFNGEAVAGLISRAVEPHKDSAKAAGVELMVFVPEGTEDVVCDGVAISKALGVVVENAVQFNRAGGSVTIELLKLTRNGAPWVVFRVADTGVGVNKQEVSRVFDPFWQGNHDIDRRFPGLGLGLTAARMAVLRHGGSLTFSSRIGQGSEVMLGLPACKSLTSPSGKDGPTA